LRKIKMRRNPNLISDNCDPAAGVDQNCNICREIEVPNPGSGGGTITIKKLVKYHPYVSRCNTCEKGDVIPREKTCFLCQDVTLPGTNPRSGLPVVTDQWIPIAPTKVNGVAVNCMRCIESGPRKGDIVNECREKEDAAEENPKTRGKLRYVCEQRGALRDAECYSTCLNADRKSTCSGCEDCVKETTLVTSNLVCKDVCTGYNVCYDKDPKNAECLCGKKSFLEYDPEEHAGYFEKCQNRTPYVNADCECYCPCDNDPRQNFDCLYKNLESQIGGCNCIYYDNNSGNVPPPWDNSIPCGDGPGLDRKTIVTNDKGCFCVPYSPSIQSLLNISLDFMP
jgi:hypothetical protein